MNDSSRKEMGQFGAQRLKNSVFGRAENITVKLGNHLGGFLLTKWGPGNMFSIVFFFLSFMMLFT